MDEQAEYAVLSKAAYDFFHGGEALAQLELQEYGLGDHSIDEALSDDRAVVITLCRQEWLHLGLYFALQCGVCSLQHSL